MVAGPIRPRHVRFAQASLVHPRGALIAEIDERWTAVSTHLGLDAGERARHVAELRTLLEPATEPRSWERTSTSARRPEPCRARVTVHRRLGGRRRGHGDHVPSHAPAARIDYLFVGPAVQALRAWTAGGTVSDHLMVVADVRLG